MGNLRSTVSRKSNTILSNAMQPIAPFNVSPTHSNKNELSTNQQYSSSKKMMVKVIGTRNHVILQKGKDCLWCSKDSGTLTPSTMLDKPLHSAPNVLGFTYGVIGKLRFFEDSDWHLLLIDDVREVGTLPPTNGKVYCIEKVSLVPLTLEKSPTEVNIETYVFDKRDKEIKDRDKLERRLKEALLHMFNGSSSFYFSPDTDLTQSTQRQHDCGDADRLRRSDRVDDRFFWNKHMITDLLNLGSEADQWILPIIQGFIQIKDVPIPSADQLGVFKKYVKKRESQYINMRSYTVIEKDDNDQLVSRSYSPDKDEVNTHSQTDDGTMKDRSVLVSSSRSKAEDIVTQKNTPSPAPEISYLVPQQPVGSVSTTGTASVESTCPLPPELLPPPRDDTTDHTPSVSPHDHTPSASPRDHTHTSSPAVSYTVPIHDEGSPSKSVTKSKDSNSMASVDTDEWINNQIEHEGNDTVDIAEGDLDEDQDDVGEAKGWGSLSGQVEWSAEGLPMIKIALVSRRSCLRAGTRYLRRGVDEEGNVANYVETEMVVLIDSHLLSFMIVRGSVPVFWTQSGQKYRPDIVIQNTEEETSRAFEKHFEEQINLYDEQVIVSLINQSGRERPVGEAYEKHLLLLDCPSLTYVAFDFHRHCKVNQWHNINLLLDKIEEYINRQHYFWYNYNGNDLLCHQKGVFRVNCVDCLDRTNVVQSIVCREVLQIALQKLGLLYPFDSLSGEFLYHYQELWANHGDIISKQYTGTAAMKGDLTRYGQRKFYGVMKDGYNSAHRFILSLFRDAYRQVIIDLQQGVAPSQALLSLPDTHKGLTGVYDDNGPIIKRRSLLSDTPSWSTNREEVIADMIRSCIEQLYPHNPDLPVQGWVLIEPLGYSFVKGSTKEEETVLLLCYERGHICVANYNAEFEHISCCIRIPLERIERIAIGQIGNILRSSPRLHLRIYYSLFPGVSCHFTFRTVHCPSPEEDRSILHSIAEAIVSQKPFIPVQEQKLTKKPSPPHEGIVYLIAPEEWMSTQMKASIASVLRPSTMSPPSTPTISEERVPAGSEESTEGDHISYVPLKSSSNTPDRQSSSGASSRMGLINEDTFNQSGYDSDSSGEGNNHETSFSLPNSPALSRRTSVFSLEERTRILSHNNSESDLTTLCQEGTELDTITTSNKAAYAHHGRTRSFAFSMDGDSSDSEDDEVLHHHRMNSVLRTIRTNRPGGQRGTKTHCKPDPDTLGDLMTFDEIRQNSFDKQEDDNLATTYTHIELDSKHNDNKRHHSESAPAQIISATQSSDGGANSSGGWKFFKGKLFGKVRSSTQQSNRASSNENSSEDISKLVGSSSSRPPAHSVPAVVKSSRHSSGKSSSSRGSGKVKEDTTAGVSDHEQVQRELEEAIARSKTRFIII